MQVGVWDCRPDCALCLRRPMHARRQACMQDACLVGLLLVLGACAAAAAAELTGDRKFLQAAADSQHAARHLLQANAGCPGPNCQTGSAGNAGGGPGGGGAGVASLGARPGPVMTPTIPTPSAASASPAAAGATALPGLSPDGNVQPPVTPISGLPIIASRCQYCPENSPPISLCMDVAHARRVAGGLHVV